jgi:hypothetical protein
MGSYERYEFHDYYNLDQPYSVHKSVSYLTNQMVHSLLFSFGCIREEGRLGIFFVSDKDRLKFCNYIDLDMVAKIFNEVAASHVQNFVISNLDGGGRSLVARD